MKSETGIYRRHLSIAESFLVLVQLKRVAMLTEIPWGRDFSFMTPRKAVPLWAIVPEMRPTDIGDIWIAFTEIAPALSPKIVIFDGSPPK